MSVIYLMRLDNKIKTASSWGNYSENQMIICDTNGKWSYAD